mmetsp:Transcript_10201/g.11668  ORF Transcript_10201/g.11668 Transcript_10201/m.11668 type:complete len:343 (-) Transcript_10201:645-1673(-)
MRTNCCHRRWLLAVTPFALFFNMRTIPLTVLSFTPPSYLVNRNGIDVVSLINPSSSLMNTRPFLIKSYNSNISSHLRMFSWLGDLQKQYPRNKDGNSEPVVVKIETLAINTRRIVGQLKIQASLEDVWSIITDYDNLSSHIPNLMESRQLEVNNDKASNSLVHGKPGDGSYRCKLYQVGAQKIIGFDFGASVTLDMTEKIVNHDRRKIVFRCAESQFFTQFDGEWIVTEETDSITGEYFCIVSYSVDVTPRGPVPVLALEWRIREDVPANLRAVRKAATRINLSNGLGKKSKMTHKNSGNVAMLENDRNAILASDRFTIAKDAGHIFHRNDWSDDETLGTYL